MECSAQHSLGQKRGEPPSLIHIGLLGEMQILSFYLNYSPDINLYKLF